MNLNRKTMFVAASASALAALTVLGKNQYSTWRLRERYRTGALSASYFDDEVGRPSPRRLRRAARYLRRFGPQLFIRVD